MKQNDKKESGRSMVDILGVLAVIGVLSIGAVVAYNRMINKHHTNEVLDMANKQAMTVSTQLTLQMPINLDEFTTVTSDRGKFSGAEEVDSEKFGIKVDDVDRKACIGIIQSIGEKGYLQRVTTQADLVTPLTAENCADEDNDLMLIYDKNMANRSKVLASGSSSGGGSGSSHSGMGTSSSSSGSGVASYCTTHECTETLPDGTAYAAPGTPMPYGDAVAVCGDEKNMFTPADLKCKMDTKECTNAPSGGYWLVGDTGDPSLGFSVYDGVLYADVGRVFSGAFSPLCK